MEKTVLSIKQGAKQNNLSIYNYLKDINSFKNELGTKILSEINKMVEAIENCKSRLVENYENYAEVLNDFLKDIGYIDYLANLDEEEDRLGNIKEFINDIRSYLKNNPESSFDEYLQNITLLTSQDELDSTLKK